MGDFDHVLAAAADLEVEVVDEVSSLLSFCLNFLGGNVTRACPLRWSGG